MISKNLIRFGKDLLKICHTLGVDPILYGSLAYSFHTHDEEVQIRDLDFIIPEEYFPKLLDEFVLNSEWKVELKPYHSIEVYKKEFEVDFDAQEVFLGKRSAETTPIQFQGMDVLVLNQKALLDIYKEALQNMPQEKHLEQRRRSYEQKLERLRDVIPQEVYE